MNLEVGLFQDGKWNINKELIQFQSGTNEYPTTFETPPHNQNLLPSYIKVIIFIFTGILILTSAICIIWTFVKRNEVKIRLSQPPFLITIGIYMYYY